MSSLRKLLCGLILMQGKSSNSITRLSPESLATATKLLAKRDRALGSIYRLHGVPPMWARRPGFATLLRIVLEQQGSLVSARSMFGRLKSNITPFTPQAFIEAGEPYL